jgi:hypothetical protein
VPAERCRHCAEAQSHKTRRHLAQRTSLMTLATTKVENFDRLLKIFATEGAEQRRL